jgi:hypothetical protein
MAHYFNIFFYFFDKYIRGKMHLIALTLYISIIFLKVLHNFLSFLLTQI